MYDPVSHLVYVTRGDDVRTTIVNGKVLMRDRQRAHARSAAGARRRRAMRRQGPRRRQSELHGHDQRPAFPKPTTSSSAIAALAAEIERDYPASEGIHLVAVLKGGFMFMADLVRAMSERVTMDFMAVSSYGKGTTSSGQVRVLKDLDSNLEGRHVILVEDIVDTGLTLHYLQDLLQARAPKSLKTACLLSKPSRRKVDVAGRTTSASRSRITSWSATGSTTRRSTATCRTSRCLTRRIAE